MALRAAVFAPHPDDETLACGGTIIKKQRQGDEVYVVVMTDGRHSHSHSFGIWENPTPQEVADIRREEAKRVTRMLGVEPDRLFLLEFEDTTLQHHVALAAERVLQLLRTIAPQEVYYPDSSDSHKDHHATYQAVEQALLKLDVPPTRFRYMVWREEPSPKGVPSSADLRVEDISDVLAEKKAALSQYKSQVTLLYKTQTVPVLRPEFLEKFVGSQEVFLCSKG
ncbi:MAG: PIG-L family deacetylase [Chloroflexota bacterium]